jgi:hypothetical protein
VTAGLFAGPGAWRLLARRIGLGRFFIGLKSGVGEGTHRSEDRICQSQESRPRFGCPHRPGRPSEPVGPKTANLILLRKPSFERQKTSVIVSTGYPLQNAVALSRTMATDIYNMFMPPFHVLAVFVPTG